MRSRPVDCSRFRGHQGSEYFPSFFASSQLDRRSLGRVAKVLARLPAPSRYQFFLNKLFPLGMTPLQALAEGRVKDVLIFASGFAER